MKLKKIFCAVAFSAAVVMGLCGCGNEKSAETGIEIKKISEEEVYELYAQVKQKKEKIEDARLSMEQGFQEKWDLLKRKMDAAELALGKNNYDTTSKFLQEAEAAADWILNRGPLRATADENFSVLSSQKSACDSSAVNAAKYASTIYAEAEGIHQQGRTAYENIEFVKAAELYARAAEIYQKAYTIASQFHSATQDVLSAKNAADEDFYNVEKYAASYYLNAAAKAKQGIDANAQGRYEEALQHLSAAESSFRQAQAEAPKQIVPAMINSFVKVEAGSFKRGEQQVTLTKDFYIGKYEVTQAQWQFVMGNNPSYYKGADRPVENVSWNDAMAFCKKLNDLGLAPAGYKFSLPTEAQWEFAARGGNRSRGYTYSGSNDPKEVAWYADNAGYDSKHHDVGTKKPNELGIYDMSGNVWEWCSDWYGAVTKEQGPEKGSRRVLRGGSWDSLADYCRTAGRSLSHPGSRYFNYGFRVALVPVQ